MHECKKTNPVVEHTNQNKLFSVWQGSGFFLITDTNLKNTCRIPQTGATICQCIFKCQHLQSSTATPLTSTRPHTAQIHGKIYGGERCQSCVRVRRFVKILYASRPRRGQTSVHDQCEIVWLKLGEIRGVPGAQNGWFGLVPNRSVF